MAGHFAVVVPFNFGYEGGMFCDIFIQVVTGEDFARRLIPSAVSLYSDDRYRALPAALWLSGDGYRALTAALWLSDEDVPGSYSRPLAR